MGHITRFSVRSNGRDLSAVRRPTRRAAAALGAVAAQANEPVALDKLNKAELAAMAEAQGLDTSGKKADLLSRLGSADG